MVSQTVSDRSAGDSNVGSVHNRNGKKGHVLLLLAIVVSVACLLGYGYYLQFVEYLDPCPLCLTQRLFYYLIGIFGVLGLLRVSSALWQKTVAVGMFLAGAGGLLVAGRQIWLQNLPPELVPECGPGLEYWLANNPFVETLQLLFKGDGNCAEIDWAFLGLSIADWSFLCFIGLMVAALFVFDCRHRLPVKNK